MQEGYLSLEDADNKQTNFATKLKNFDKVVKAIEKKYFLNNLGFFFVQEKKFLITLKADYFQ